MITLMTGLPRNCKTLFSIWFVKRWAEREKRPVYYFGIPELKLPWIQIQDPTKWYEEVPDGAIVVGDEAQEFFRAGGGKEVPEHVAKLERHGHRGLDFWLISQHPMLIHPNVRKLTQTHKHAVRIWGMEASTIHTWTAVRENCEKPVARKDSEKEKWVFDKSIYDLYKSSAMHTVKRSIPKRLLWLLLLPVAIVAAVLMVKSLMFKPEPVSSGAPVAVPGQVVSGHIQNKPVFDPVADAKEYVYKQTPRVQGFQFTAPKYDEITKATMAPVPAACVRHRRGCDCYSQQGTRLNTTPEQCGDIVEHGYFQEFDPNGKGQGDVHEVKQQNPSIAS